MALADAADGRTVAEYDWGPFGKPLAAKGESWALEACRFGFSTKYTDAETGLLYFGHRYYDPLTGRWLSREPLGESESVNLYAYCHNDPVGCFDFLGLETVAQLQAQITHLEKLIEDFDGPGGMVISHFRSEIRKKRLRISKIKATAFFYHAGVKMGAGKAWLSGDEDALIEGHFSEVGWDGSPDHLTYATNELDDTDPDHAPYFFVGGSVAATSSGLVLEGALPAIAYAPRITKPAQSILNADVPVPSPYPMPQLTPAPGGGVLNMTKFDAITGLPIGPTPRFPTFSRISGGSKFKDHFIRHARGPEGKILESMTDRSFRKFKTDGESFLNAIRDVINRGADPFGAVPGRSVFFVGEGTLRRGGDVLRIYRGNGITIAVKPNGEFVTLLKSGEGLDLAIQFVK